MPRSCRVLVLLALASAFVAGTSFGQQKITPSPEQAVHLVIGLANEFRAQEGRNEVAVNAQLTKAARYMAGYMAETGGFGHNADGSDPATRARQHGYHYCIVSENIAYRYSSAGFTTRELAQGLVEGWKHSPGHRRNMLDPDVTETGAAVVRSAQTGYYYAVQMFGRPSSQEINFRITNQSNATIRYRLGGKTLPLAPRQTRIHQQCRSEELRIVSAGTQQDTAIRPGNGDRLAIVRSDSGGFSLKRE